MTCRQTTTENLTSLWTPIPKQLIWQWAEENIDFSLSKAYDTPLHGRYSADFMPFWKEPVEALSDPSISEIWVLKCSRAGGSENLLLNPIRYAIACEPQPILYISGDQKSVERFMEKRIKLGLYCAGSTRRKLKAARSLEHEIYFADMDLIVTWPKNKMAFKQTGYKLILGDEVSTWPGFSADMMRKRTDTYSFSHICCISSPDPQAKRGSHDDPIFQEFWQTDQRYWYMPDPVTGELFRFEMGGPDSFYGLKWDARAKDQNDEWDLDKVRESAYYITPAGTRIDNKDRQGLVAEGQWVVSVPDSPANKRGYHINAFYMPFKSGDFGHIAAAFLSAKKKGKHALKVFVYEYLGEEWVEEKEAAEDDQLYARQRDYRKGQRFSEADKWTDIYKQKPKAVFTTIDVQKGHLWGVSREWVDGGDSGLIDHRYLITWEDVEKFANESKATRVLVDVGYANRAMEVYDYAFRCASWPTLGRDNLSLPYKKTIVDPFEGKSGQGKHSVIMYQFNTDIFKTLLMDLVRGESEKSWYIYDLIEHLYVQQVASEERVDGEWKMKRGHPDNHLWDCEVLQLLAATIHGLYRNEWMETVTGG